MNTDTRKRMALTARLTLFALALSPLSMLAQDSAPAGPPPSADGQPGGHGRDHQDPAQRQAHMLEILTHKLNLTPDQVTQIKGIQTDSLSQMQALHSDSSVQGPDRRAKAMDIHKGEQDKIRAVLNDDQRAKFDAMEARQHERHAHGKGDQDAPPPPAA